MKRNRLAVFLLTSIGKTYTYEHVSFSMIVNTYVESLATSLLSSNYLYDYAVELEVQTFLNSKDLDLAWEASRPYYQAASYKKHPRANYRMALGEAKISLEFGYAHYLSRAVKYGDREAIIQFYKNYDRFRVKTITKHSYRTKKEQEKMYFACCQYLAEEGKFDALKNLAWCYVLGKGVRRNPKLAADLLQDALVQGNVEESHIEEVLDLLSLFSENIW